MGRGDYLRVATLAVCAAGTAAAVVIPALDRRGGFSPARFSAYTLLLASPFAGVAALTWWWRAHRLLPAAGLAAAGACLGLTLWGNLTDYTQWRASPPGQEVTHLAGFVALLGCWALCVGLLGAGFVMRPVRTGTDLGPERAAGDHWVVGGEKVPAPRGRGRAASAVRLVPLALYVAACVAPAVETRREHPPGAVMSFSNTGDPIAYPGWAALALGWLVALGAVSDLTDPLRPFQVGGLAWLANPLGLAGLILLRCRRARAAAACAWFGVGLGAAFLVFPPENAGRPVVPLVGAYLWAGSLGALAVGASAAGVSAGARPRHPPGIGTRAATGVTGSENRSPT